MPSCAIIALDEAGGVSDYMSIQRFSDHKLLCDVMHWPARFVLVETMNRTEVNGSEYTVLLILTNYDKFC